MPNATHLKVLLTKDLLTLRRNIGFVFAFCILPLALMGAFIAVQGLVDNGELDQSLIDKYFFYTSTRFMPYQKQVINSPFMDVPPAKINPDGGFPTIYASSLQKCYAENKQKYYYSKVAFIAEDEKIRNDGKEFFEKYVFKTNGFPSNFTVETFSSQEDAFTEYKKDEKTPYCFGVTITKFDLKNDDFEVSFSFGKD
jgi:hypothetical protein